MSSRTRNAVTSTLVDLLPLPGADPRSDLPPLSAVALQQVRDRVCSPDFDAWSQALASVGNCARPIRLHGRSERVDRGTGAVLSAYSSDQEPLGVTYVRCGNRRANACPSCSRLYAADTFHLIRAGMVGGKTVPAAVVDNPLVFATLTAPSFGTVHGRRDNCRACRPHTTGSARCQHNRPRTCRSAHAEADPALGQPLCEDCYYASQVWQWWAPDLFRRFTITLRRLVAASLAVPAGRLSEIATVQYAKVAEYQVRGVVHFHALVRLDGPRTPDAFAPAPPAITAEHLADLRRAAASVRLAVPGVDDADPARVLAFGRQLDARPVRTSRRTDDPDASLRPEQVAGYLAKYATKSAADTGAGAGAHHRRLRATVRHLAVRAATSTIDPPDAGPYELLGKWEHMLGFRGHFASKSRRYSITLGALRRARRRAQVLIADARATGRPLDLAALEADLLAHDDHDTTLVLGSWTYAGAGWSTEGDRVLALAAAARAREYAQERAQQRHHTPTDTADRTR